MSAVWGIEGRAEYTPLDPGADEDGDGVGQHAPVERGSGQGEAAEIARLRATVADLEAQTSKHDEELRHALGEREALQKQLASREGSGAAPEPEPEPEPEPAPPPGSISAPPRCPSETAQAVMPGPGEGPEYEELALEQADGGSDGVSRGSTAPAVRLPATY